MYKAFWRLLLQSVKETKGVQCNDEHHSTYIIFCGGWLWCNCTQSLGYISKAWTISCMKWRRIEINNQCMCVVTMECRNVCCTHQDCKQNSHTWVATVPLGIPSNLASPSVVSGCKHIWAPLHCSCHCCFQKGCEKQQKLWQQWQQWQQWQKWQQWQQWQHSTSNKCDILIYLCASEVKKTLIFMTIWVFCFPKNISCAMVFMKNSLCLWPFFVVLVLQFCYFRMKVSIIQMHLKQDWGEP